MELRSQTNNVTTMQVGPWSQAENLNDDTGGTVVPGWKTVTTMQVGPWSQAENLNDDTGGTVVPG